MSFHIKVMLGGREKPLGAWPLPLSEEVEEAVLLEILAELNHIQWWRWSRGVAIKNNLRIETVERWEKLWIDYPDLLEERKEENRKHARKILENIREIKHEINKRRGG